MSDNDWVDRLRPATPNGATTIAAERSRSNVDVDGLSKYLLGQGYLRCQSRILSLLQQDPLFNKSNQANLARPDRYMLALARAKRLRQMAKRYGWADHDHEMAIHLVDDVSPYQLDVSMFRQTLREQTSPAQREYWLRLHETWTIVGAYAQTELGHGSNVRGIETTARWDPNTKEFILHSPSLTASKWWNGSLGRTATHSIVVAQLLLPEHGSNQNQPTYQSYGPHTFVIRVRDAETHKPLPGIVIGDIGPKYGYASMDNAYMLFNNFRIPHDAMLSRYSYVDPETGKYRKPENPAVAYGSMTHARKRIIMMTRMVLARAVTISIRYCSIRRQFHNKESGSPVETAVLDYPTVQIRLLPLLATTYALHYTGERMGQIYDATRSRIDAGDLSTLVDLHSLSSGLKSLATELAAGGIETCRRAMGGHGYGGGSGLVQLNADFLSKPTVEGDNWMITQQMARYLIKKAELITKAKQPFTPSNQTESVLHEYFRTHPARQTFPIYTDDKYLVSAFAHRAAYLTFEAYTAHKVDGRSWNTLLVELHELSHAQSEFILVSNFFGGLRDAASLSPVTQEVLWSNFRLFALHTMHKSSRQFSKSGAVSSDDLDRLPDRILQTMHIIRPHAVRLVDAWSIPDYLLDSALGRSDGKVYEDLFHRAHRLNPLNKLTFNPDYRTDEIVKGSNDGGDILAKL